MDCTWDIAYAHYVKTLQLNDGGIILLLIAHRGYSDERPENTFSSFDHALNSGYPYVEFDVQLTRDQVPVIIHDPKVDRTTDGTGFVHDLTLSQIKTLDASSWYLPARDRPATPQRIPTLKEMLERYHGRANIFIELKSPAAELVKNVHASLHTSGWLDGNHSPDQPFGQIFIIAFDSTQLLRSSQAIPSILHGLLVPEISQSTITQCMQNGWKGILPFVKGISRSTVDQAQKQGLFVGAWGTSTEEELLHAAQTKVDALTIDWPIKATRILTQTQ